MACLNMQMNEQQQGGFLGPRISFSNDFADTQQTTTTTTTNLKNNNTYREAPVSSEFEFSVPCFASNSADELFFKKTKILPLKEKPLTTLRDELLAPNDDDDDDIFFPKASGWWRFGKSQTQSQSLNLNHNGSLAAKKGDHKNNGGLDTIDEANQYLRK
ncbi:hypothetical protein HanRHA438_Chr04g0201661 [Helianthus annuus]|nr:hypothetical protein HanIR_Chr04g0206971 [Helianthus annuus]KAJ0929138.1 hypothetical protein HanRHA438_Chr04g0201661 [Helianthus annuus]KAJ0933503.1 hypothetical protein HanPSC8_Chr04g0185551 [Helianthus annuus]